jgi:hypothetical protein
LLRGISGDNAVVESGTGLAESAVIFFDLVRINPCDKELLGTEEHGPALWTQTVYRGSVFFFVGQIGGLLLIPGHRGNGCLNVHNEYWETHGTNIFIAAASGKVVVIDHFESSFLISLLILSQNTR